MFEIKNENDLREVFASLDEIIRALMERSANNHIMLHEVEVMSTCVDSLRLKCFPVAVVPFYPLPGTVFARLGSCTPYVVTERDKPLHAPGGIYYNDHMNGISEFPNWLTGVRDGGVEIIWCPREGKIASNEIWLKNCGLS
jgi:hypothetical protein